MSTEDDRNLLFGVLAMQLCGVSPAQLAQCASSWAVDRSRGLPAYLVDAGFLNQPDCDKLSRLVDDAIKAHAGDIRATLADFGGAECIDRTFLGQITISSDDEITVARKGILLGQLDESVPAVEETPGRYTSVSEYARGGMGRVLLVHDEHLNREVAMKELLPFLSEEDETQTPRRQAMTIISRFLQEARLTGQLEHPSIIPVYELGRHPDGSLYYTMKLVRGQTLSSVLKGKSSLADRLGLLPHFLDVCQAIAYAHSKGVIHRDIKPANIMIGEFGETVVLDWGLAKALRDKTEHPDNLAETLRALKMSPSIDAVKTTHGQVLGTPVYMPPEQASGELELVDERSDVYSLGAVLYEILTGRRPYRRGKPLEVLQRVVSEHPEPILGLEPLAPPELAAICGKAMEREREDRYENALDLAAEMTRFQTGAYVAAYRYSMGDYLRRWVKRHKAAAMTAVAAVALIAVLSVVYVLSLQQKNQLLAQSREQEQIQRINAEHARDRAETHSYLLATRFASEYLDSNRSDRAYQLLWNAPESRRNWEWGHLLYRSRQYAYLLPQCGVATYSPDGRSIATISRQNGAQLWNAADGRLLSQMQDVTPDRLMTIHFSPDGAHVAAAGMAGLLKIWDPATGKLVSALGPSGGVIEGIDYSPDGNRVVAVSSAGNAAIWNLSSKAIVRTLDASPTKILRATFSSDGSLITTVQDDDTVCVWQEDSDGPRYTFPGRLPRFRPGTHELAVVLGSDVLSYNADTGQETGFRVTNGDIVKSLRYSPEGTLLAIGGENGTSVVLQANDGLPIVTLNHGEPLSDTIFNPDSSMVLTLSNSGLLKVWHLPEGAEIARFRGHSDRVTGAEFSPDNYHFLSMGYDHVVHVWNAFVCLGETTVAHIGEPIVEMCTATEARRLALASASGETHVVDLHTHEGIAAFSTFVAMPFPHCAFSPDGKLLALAADGITPIVWNVEDRAIVASLTEHSERISRITFSPDSQRLAIGHSNGMVRIFDVLSGQESATLSGHTDEITAIRFLSDGTRLITASNDTTAAIWDAESGRKTLDLSGHTGAILGVAVWPDGSHVMTSSRDMTIREWDTATGESRIVVHNSPESPSYMTCLSNQSRICFAAQDDRTARLWDAANDQELIQLGEHTGALSGIYYDPESSAVLTASRDGTVRASKAAPWVVDTLPGPSTDSWQARFAALHDQALSQDQPPDLYAQASELVVAVPGNILSSLAGKIRESLSAPEREGASPNVIVDESLGQVLQPLGVESGDTLQNLNDVSLSSASAATELETLQTEIDQGRLSGVELRLIRNGQPTIIQYRVLQPVQKEDRVQLPAERLLEIIGRHQKMLVENRANILQVNQDVLARIGGLYAMDAGGPGFWIMEGSEPDEKEALSSLHLQSKDRCLSIGGTPVTSIEGLEAILSRIAERIQSGEFSSTNIVVMRGTFQRVEIDISIS